MSLTVTQRPNQNGVWVAAKNPVIYKMIRKDYTWVAVFNSAGNLQIQISGGVDLTAIFYSGQKIWVQADDGSYSSSATITSSSYVGVTLVTTDITYSTNTPPGYVNLLDQRPNYYANIGVYKSTDNSLISSVNYYPTKYGTLTIDVSSSLLSILYPDILQILNGVILQDANTTEGFYIKYTEVWTGSANSATNDVANISYSVFGAKQIGQDSYLSSYLATQSIGGLPLTKLDTMKLGLNEYYSISYISIGGTMDWIKKSWYLPNGVLQFSTFIKSTNNTNAYSNTNVPASVYTLFQKFSFSESITPDRNIAISGGDSWSSNSLMIINGHASTYWSSPFFMANGTTTTISGNFTITGNATPVNIDIVLFNISGTNIASATLVSGSNGTYTGSISFSNSSGSDGYFIGIGFSNLSGANKTVTINFLSCSLSDIISRVDFKGVVLYDGVLVSLASWLNAGLGTSWTITGSPTVHLTAAFESSKILTTPMPIRSGVTYKFGYSITIPTTINVVGIATLDNSNTIVETLATFTSTSSGTLTVIPTISATKIAIYAQATGAGNQDVTINSFSLNSMPYTESPLFESIRGDVMDCTKNPVTVMWRNKLGGESSWTFNINQDYVQKLQDPFVNNWKTVYDLDLTLGQFNALNELFGIGQVYQTPLVELTTSIDKTEARYGQQVYIVDSNGNKTGVIVIGQENKTQTKREKHNFQATLELPEIFG